MINETDAWLKGGPTDVTKTLWETGVIKQVQKLVFSTSKELRNAHIIGILVTIQTIFILKMHTHAREHRWCVPTVIREIA
jgi:hypothetical protein